MPDCPNAQKYTPQEIQPLITYIVNHINDMIPRIVKSMSTQDMGVRGLETAKITKLEFGDETEIKPCYPSCNCKKSAGVEIKNMKVVAEVKVVVTDSSFPFSGKVNVTLKGVTLTIETDCRERATITKFDVDDVELDGAPSKLTKLGMAIALAPKATILKRWVKDNILKKNFVLPVRLTDMPLVCLAK